MKLEGRDFVLNIFFNFRTDVSYSFFVCFRYRVESGPGPGLFREWITWIFFGFLLDFSQEYCMFRVKII